MKIVTWTPRTLIITIRPARPAWDAETRVMDLDNLTRTERFTVNHPAEITGYLMGNLDRGYHILGLKWEDESE